MLALTALTQVGGAILLLAMAVGRLFPNRGIRRALGIAATFVVAYAASSMLIVPPLAALGGRVPMPCAGEPLRTLPVLCALNRHYVSPRLRILADALATDLNRQYPGSVTLALDANFPFFDGFPLLPHLSHDDGNKLDLSYFYTQAGTYLPAVSRSPVGYWAFETPAAGEETQCAGEGLSMRWDLQALQPLFPKLEMEPYRTRFALQWLSSKGPDYGLQRAFVEPYVARRLGTTSPLLGFQGCRAARHDDHIHLQIAPR